jgi:hypothetical protein
MVYSRCCQQFRLLVIVTNDRAIVSNKLDTMWKEAVACGVIEGRTEVNQEKPQSG